MAKTNLPCHLRTCLLYLSAFPEDYTINKHSLIWKWIAEDFIHKKPGIGLLEVGEGYFNELVNRSMIQAAVSRYDGIIYGCRVHDMVLDLLRSLSREENFVTILDSDEGTSSISTARRLANQKSTIETHLDSHNSMEKLRSFIAYRYNDDKEPWFLRFKLLRVLHLEDVYIKSWHNNAKYIGNLLHLRYLGLKYTGIGMHELPKEIGDLKLLQTLDLVNIEELPRSIGQLTQLVCLRAWGSNDRGTTMPNGIIKKLTSLEELMVQCYIEKHDKGQFMKELGNLSELRVLTVKVTTMNQSMLSDLLQSVGNLHKIQSVKLESCSLLTGLYNADFDAKALPRHLRHLLVPVDCYSFSRFPSSINPSCLINLSHLQLHVISMDEKSMQILGGLPELRHLGLLTESTVTVTNIATDGCFQKLRSCKFFTSMVLFVLNEDSSVSFTIWNGVDDIVFGSRRKDDECGSGSASAVMPNLEVLFFEVQGDWSTRKSEGSYGNLGLEYLTSLHEVTVTVNHCQYSCEEDMMKAEAELKHAVSVNPNHPTLILRFY